MLKRIGGLALISLWGGLSCAIWTGVPKPGTGRVSVSGPRQACVYGPDRIEWAESRFLSYQTGLSRSEIRAAAETLVTESRRWDLDPELVAAVIHTESAYLNFAVSPVGALGLMQIMPETGAYLARESETEYSAEQLLDPVTNIRLGTRYLAYLFHRFGSWERALAAYNWGPDRIDRRIRRRHRLPQRYVARVMLQLQSPPRP